MQGDEQQKPVEQPPVDTKMEEEPAWTLDNTNLRSLKIKIGVLKRNMKDFTSYKKEEGLLVEKVEKAKEEQKDEHDIKKMMEGVQETSETLALCKPRIETALDDLENLMATIEESIKEENQEALKQVPEWQQTESICKEAKTFVDQIEIW